MLCTALWFNGTQITAHWLLQVVKAGHFKSFSKVSALGYPVFLSASYLVGLYTACAVTYLVQNVACAPCDNMSTYSPTPNHIRCLPALVRNARFFYAAVGEARNCNLYICAKDVRRISLDRTFFLVKTIA